MAKQKRTALDEVANRLRGWLEDLDRLLNPGQSKRTRVPVPVPVRAPRDPKYNSYR